jgi:CMP-N-acetylneuraminic acid synthetase
LALEGRSVLAVIPARGGSKGIPAKNLQHIGGKSLIGHAATVALATPAIDRVIVSTDDKAIAAEGERCGAWVPFLRPAHLASDTARSIDVWKHAWQEAEALDGHRYDLSVLLEPTSPMRRAEDIARALDIMVRQGAAAAATVSRTPAHYTPHKTLTVDTQGRIGFYLEQGARFARRQDIPVYFHRNGICYAAKRKTVLDDMTIIENDCIAVEITRDVVNIDEPVDLLFAEFLLSRERQAT